ncbi:LuxR C-terminal-related transcriptional regulator, partial [Citrobacter freundii]|nr:LuxR C-terminal-related transcriptional regulator [Citrobacter freundii]
SVRHIFKPISYLEIQLLSGVSGGYIKQDKLDTLSNQEMRVLRYILNGMDYSSIASKMNISNKTVSTYKSRLMEKLDCSSLMEIYDYAQRNKIG